MTKVEIRVPEPSWRTHAETTAHIDNMANALARVLRDNGISSFLTDDYGGGEGVASGIIHGVAHLSYHTKFQHPQFIHWKDGYLPGWFYFDRKGYGLFSTLAESTNFAEMVTDKEVEETQELLHSRYVVTGDSKYLQWNEVFVEPERPFLFLPTQVPGDEAVLAAKIDMYDFVVRTVTGVCFDTEWEVVVKAHPKDGKPRMREEVRDLARKYSRCHKTNAPIHTILSSPMCRGVVCVNSGVGFEALLHSLPVFAAGPTDYRPAAYAFDPTTPLTSVVERAQRHNENHCALIRKWLAYCANHYFVDYTRPSTIDRVVQLIKAI